MLDLGTRFRRLGKRLEESEIEDIYLNDRKALEWLSRLEQWASKCERELELKLLKHEGSVAAARYSEEIDG